MIEHRSLGARTLLNTPHRKACGHSAGQPVRWLIEINRSDPLISCSWSILV